MKLFHRNTILLLVLFTFWKQYGQHHSHIIAEANVTQKTLTIEQELVFFNQSEDSLTSIVLNDWMNAHSSKTSPLAKRFSDEFYRGFHLAKEEERGNTSILSITNFDKSTLFWNRKSVDLITIQLPYKLAPNQKITLQLNYIVKIPSDKFSDFGYTINGGMNLKNWFLTPARYENQTFVEYSNYNLDDIANASSDFEIDFRTLKNIEVSSDLKTEITQQDEDFSFYKLTGNNRTDISLYLEPKSTFRSYKNSVVEVLTNINDYRTDEIKKAITIDQIVNFTNDLIGKYPFDKITVSQADYNQSPFYGLNQLPAIVAPFPNDFLFEIKFLKTYLNNYLKNTLKLDLRKDSWIYDGIQVYAMMRYMEEYHPNAKMTGSVSKYKLFKGYNLINLNFNEQYSYFYLLMARKNLDQPLNSSKDNLIKFNEKIASKYRAGLSLMYLDEYVGAPFMSTSIQQFNVQNREKQTTRNDFETVLKSNTNKNIDWFFKTIIDTRDIIDYKFKDVSKTKDSISFSLKSKTNITVPMPIYGIKNDSIVFKKWIEPNKHDSIYNIERKEADKIVINYNNEVPEFNLRNNFKKLEGFFPNNRPFKFTLIKDLENPRYNQIIYTPILTYNVYDGLSPGMRFQNKAILNRPFVYDLNPTYSLNSKTVTGNAIFMVNKDYRNSNLFNVRYSISGNYYHYAPDATYLRLNPMILMQIRKDDFRDNTKQLISIRQVMVDRQKSNIVVDNSLEDYSVFDLRYVNSKTELTNHISYSGDVQISGEFGKVSTNVQFRKLFEDNRQLTLRLYAGSFLYNTTNSDFFSFALDRPTDYLFDYAYLGRSSSSGIASQEFIMAEGGFKSKLNTPYANEWISTLNASYSIWNWIETYGDIGFVKNTNQSKNFVYDSGIRFNFLTDYFELYFPVYSNNGWEIAQPNYTEKIRFVVTLDPNKLVPLFTRKWF